MIEHYEWIVHPVESQVSEFNDDLFSTFSVAVMQRNTEGYSLEAPISLPFCISKICDILQIVQSKRPVVYKGNVLKSLARGCS